MFVNLTPHVVTIRTDDGDLVIEPSGMVARRSVTEEPADPVNNVPAVRRAFGPVEGLPAPKAGTVYIVSSLVLEGIRNRDDVVSPDTGSTAIRENGQVVAITRFVRSQ